MEQTWNPSLDVEHASSIPYFNWDCAVSNAEVRAALKSGSEDEKLFWIGRILREARYPDVWRYLSLTTDILPRWERVRGRLGRQRAFWEYLVEGWRRDDLVP
jgi:hypothetical protein